MPVGSRKGFIIGSGAAAVGGLQSALGLPGRKGGLSAGLWAIEAWSSGVGLDLGRHHETCHDNSAPIAV